MKTTLSQSQAIHLLLSDEFAKRTYEEATALVEYYEDMEDSIGVQIEFDIEDMRSIWQGYTEEELLQEYGEEGDDIDDVANSLERETTIIECDGTWLVQKF